MAIVEEQSTGADPPTPPGVERLLRLRRWVVVALVITLLALAIALLNKESRDLLMNWMALKAWAGDGMGMYSLAAIYVACLAIPFLPGVEIGLLLMVIYGRPGIALAWIGTLVGLNLAYLAGRMLGHTPTGRYLAKRVWLLSDPARGDSLGDRRGWLARLAVRARYLVLAILFNLPGNWLIGGGGGIAMVAGMGKGFRWHWFALTVALATILLPLLAWFGVVQLTPILEALTGD